MPSLYSGYRFYRQLTKGARLPSYEVTDEYRKYVSTLPPDEQVEAVERVIADMSSRRKSYMRRHFPSRPDINWEYPLSSFTRNSPYSFKTHPAKYYH